MPHLAPIPQLKFQRGITTGDSSSAQLIYPSLPKLATGRPPRTNAASSTLRFTARSIASRDKDTCSLNITIGDSGSPLRPRPDSAHCPWSLWHRLPLGVILHFSCPPMKAIAGDQVTCCFRTNWRIYCSGCSEGRNTTWFTGWKVRLNPLNSMYPTGERISERRARLGRWLRKSHFRQTDLFHRSQVSEVIN